MAETAWQGLTLRTRELEREIADLKRQASEAREAALLEAENAVLESGDGSCCAQKHAAAICALRLSPLAQTEEAK